MPVEYKIMKVEGPRECHRCGRILKFTGHADIILYMDAEVPENNPKTVGYVCTDWLGCLSKDVNYALPR